MVRKAIPKNKKTRIKTDQITYRHVTITNRFDFEHTSSSRNLIKGPIDVFQQKKDLLGVSLTTPRRKSDNIAKQDGRIGKQVGHGFGIHLDQFETSRIVAGIIQVTFDANRRLTDQTRPLLQAGSMIGSRAARVAGTGKGSVVVSRTINGGIVR